MNTSEVCLPFDEPSIRASFFISMATLYANEGSEKFLQPPIQTENFYRFLDGKITELTRKFPYGYECRIQYDESMWSVKSMHYGMLVRLSLRYKNEQKWVFELNLSKPLAGQGTYLGEKKDYVFNPGAVVHDSRLCGSAIYFVSYTEED